MLSVVERVNNGIEFLNENIPGWRQKIDKDILDIFSASTCIWGQLGWPRFKGLETVINNTDITSVYENGFMGYNFDGDEYEEDCEQLTAEWKKRL